MSDDLYFRPPTTWEELQERTRAETILSSNGHAIQPPLMPNGDRGVSLVRGSTVRMEPVRWLGPGLPIGNGTLIAGPPGLAKTTLLCEWAARVTRGQLAGEFHGRPADAVLMSGEDSISNTLAPRFVAAGGDLERVHFVEFGDDGFAIPDDLERLAVAVKRLELPALVGIDPLMAFVADRIDSHKDHHVRRAFGAIRRFAAGLEVATGLVAHLNKAESRDFLNRVNGSVGIGAAVRSAWAVVEHPEDASHRALVHTKSNLGPYEPSIRFRLEARTAPGWDGRDVDTSGIVWLGQDPGITRSNVLDDNAGPDREERDEAVGFLRSSGILARDRPAREVIREAEAQGITKTTLHRARRELGVLSRKKRFDGPWMWGPPQDATPTPSPVQSSTLPAETAPSEPQDSRGDGVPPSRGAA